MPNSDPHSDKRNPLVDEAENHPERQKGELWDPSEPWDVFDGSQRAMDKTRLIKWLTYCPKGCPLVRCVRACFPADDAGPISERSYDNTDYKFAKRFLERTKYAELDTEGPITTAYPTTAAFHLTARKHNSNTASRSFAKDRAEAYIGHIQCVDDVKDARFLVREFSTYLRSIEDKRLMLQEEIEREKKLTLPYATRFTSEIRKNDQWRKYHTAWETATEKYDTGLLLTLTTDPKRHDSLLDMVDSVMESWSKLLEALNRRCDVDGRLDFIRALEFTGSEDSTMPGLPHLHIVVFGTGYIDHGWLKNQWSARRDHGEIVHVDAMNDRGENDWVVQLEDGSLNAAGYLGKYLAEALDSAEELTSGDLRDRMQDWDDMSDYVESSTWKLALYWATGRQFWDCSHALKPDSKPDRLEDVDGLGETKLKRLKEAGIRTLSDVRLADVAEIAAIDGISESFAQDLKDLVGEPSDFDVYNFEFVGAATPAQMPAGWSAGARHMGVG